MYEEMFKERLIKLRMQKDVSARDMSLSLGQSESYINKIETKDTLPSMTVFFYICEYFKITPKEFFDVSVENPKELNEIIENLKKLNSDQLAHINAIIKDIKKLNDNLYNTDRFQNLPVFFYTLIKPILY